MDASFHALAILLEFLALPSPGVVEGGLFALVLEGEGALVSGEGVFGRVVLVPLDAAEGLAVLLLGVVEVHFGLDLVEEGKRVHQSLAHPRR